MKRTSLVAIIIAIATNMFAQETHFGIKGGINLAKVEISEGGNDYDTRPGIHLGGLAHIHFTKHFALQPELVYSMQGGESGDVKLKLNYINLPVLAQFMVNNGFRLQTGPQIGFLLSAESEVGNLEVDVEDQMNSIDFGWVIGLGYLFPQGIGIDTRFNIGISNISDDSDFEARNRVLQVGLFYQFMKRKS